ncbi:MAG: proton-conducting transporter membrane subunit, partial [Desulfobacteraceae bacterium]
LLILSYIGNLDILTLNQIKIGGAMSSELLTLSVLLIFGGIAGKSAQFPLLTWLPDAMEGPTPVSALLHSATMVAAGVYLFGRLFPFFSLSPTAMGICLLIGTLSMLLASTMAMVSRDIKQVWAFSTISQLGFMIMGLAAGNLFAGLFHLTTHAGFKALLFLCSGVFIHHFNTNDIQELGEKGGRRLIIPMLCMTLGAAALSGLPPLSGFYSKEVILMALAELGNPVWLLAGLLGVFLTSYYTFRLIFLILCPADNSTVQGEKNHHDHKHDRIMVLPLIILTVITIGLGGCENALSHFLLSLELHDNLLHTDTHLAYLPYSALGLAIFGVLLSFIEFGRPKARQIGFIEKYPRLAELFAQRWYLDNFYRFLVNQVIDRGISAGCSQTDQKIIDGGIDGLAGGTIVTGRILSELQSCIFQYRLMVIFVVMIITALYFLF